MSHGKITYEKLLAYAAGELPQGEAAEVEAHLSRDLAAAETVGRYRRAVAILAADDSADPPPEAIARARAIFDRPPRAADRSGLADQLGRLVARLLFDSRAQPALAGLRGRPASFQMTWQIPADGEMELDLQAEAAGGEQWQLVGQVTSPSQLPELRIDLCRTESPIPVQSVMADDRGSFLFRVEPGAYDLHLHTPDRVTVVPDIQMG